MSQTAVHPYQNHSWVYACARAYARNLAPLPRRLAAKKDPTKFLEEHPLYDVWRDPNPMMNSLQLWEAIILNLLLPTTRSPGGQCFLVLTAADGQKVDIQRGEIPFQIWPYNDEMVKPKTQGNRFLGWTLTIPGEAPLDFEPHEVVRIRLLNPGNPLRGLSPFTPVRQSVEIDAKALQFDNKTLDNGGVLQGVLSTDQSVNVETLKEMWAMWQQNFGGSKNAGKTAILANGLKYQEIARSASEMAFMESRKYSRSEILAAYHVPPIEAGIYEDMSGLNATTAQVAVKHFWGVLKTFDGGIWTDLNDNWIRFIDGGKWVGVSDYSDVQALQDDYKDKIASMKTLYDMAVPVAESSRLLRVPMKLEEYPWTSSALVQGTMVDVQQVEEVNAARIEGLKAGKPDPNAAPAAGDPPAEPPPAKLAKPEPRSLPEQLRVIAAERKARWEGYVARMFDPGEKGVRKAAEKFFVGQRNRHLDKVDAWLAAEAKDAPFILTRAAEVPGDLEFSEPEKADEDKRLQVSMTIPLATAQELAQQAIEEELKDAEFELPPAKTSAQILEQVKKARIETLPQINTTTFQAAHDVIGETLNKAVDENWTVAEMSKALKDSLRDVYQVRISNASTIARTETGAIASGTRQGLMREAGVEYQEWLSAHDDRVRESHMDEDGNIAALDDAFPVTGLRYPHDPDGDPDEVVNCRCVLTIAKAPDA